MSSQMSSQTFAPLKPLKPGLVPGVPAFPWPTAPVVLTLLVNYLLACVDRKVQYGLGCKADAGGAPLAAYPPRFSAIDCSGWVRAAVAYATGGRVVMPDGSVNQNDWCAAAGLKRSDWPSLLRSDGILRIGFIRPSAAHPIGHVYLCVNGKTLESWGGNGPGRRSPLVHVLQARTTDVYVLEIPNYVLEIPNAERD